MTTPNEKRYVRCNYCDGTVYAVKGILTCDACGKTYNLLDDHGGNRGYTQQEEPNAK